MFVMGMLIITTIPVSVLILRVKFLLPLLLNSLITSAQCVNMDNDYHKVQQEQRASNQSIDQLMEGVSD